MKVLSEEERIAIETWLKKLDEGSSDFYTYTTDDSMRAYQDGLSLAYGDMRQMVREKDDFLSALPDYVAQWERRLKKAWSGEETLCCRGRLAAVKGVLSTLKIYEESQDEGHD